MISAQDFFSMLVTIGVLLMGQIAWEIRQLRRAVTSLDERIDHLDIAIQLVTQRVNRLDPEGKDQ